MSQGGFPTSPALVVVLSLLVPPGCSVPRAVSSDDVDRCYDCHGELKNGNEAPPPAFWEENDLSAGAHQSHLGVSDWHPEILCEDCHIVPESVLDEGHLDSDLPAELTWGALATADDAVPTWDGKVCGNVYCHGATLEYTGGTITEPNWTIVDGSEAECGTCHGAPPDAPHPSGDDCSRCHPTANADQEIVDAARHIDGVLDLEELECDSCHGSGGEAAPPLDLAGNTDTTFTGVGAHREHLASSDWHAPVTCDQCHVEPMEDADPGHRDDALPAELTWGTLATADGASPMWDGVTCGGVYCHGSTLLPGGSETTPEWTLVDGTQSACGTCHGSPPGGTHSTGTGCHICHAAVVDDTLAFVDPTLHINGVVDEMAVHPAGWADPAMHGSVPGGTSSCEACHGANLDGGLVDISCDSCHPGWQSDCTFCHGDAGGPAPPESVLGLTATTVRGVGAHAEHLATGSTWRADITCNQCHVVPSLFTDAGHLDGDGIADLIWGPVAAADSATPMWDGTTETCSGVYCHGATLLGGPGPSPVWTLVDGSQAACGTCHTLPPGGSHPASGVCVTCHSSVIDASFVIIDPALHINGSVDF